MAFTAFASAPQILTQAGATTPQQINVSAWIPATASAYVLQNTLFRGWSDANGNLDVAALVRLGSDLTHDYAKLGQLDGAGLTPGKEFGCGGQTVIIPGNQPFYWLIEGDTLSSGTDLTLCLLGYFTDVATTVPPHTHPVSLTLGGTAENPT